MLSQRKWTVLKAIVGEYILTAAPVASASVVQRRLLPMSSATVRHEMASLEEEGYICRPHPSAGGVPSDKGYRFYVESLPNIAEPSSEVQIELQHRFEQTEPGLEAWGSLAATALSGVIRNLAVVSLPRYSQIRLRHLEVVYLQELLLLVVLVIQETTVRKQLLSLATPLSREELPGMTERLNQSFTGLTNQEIQKQQTPLSPVEDRVREAISRMLNVEEAEASIDYFVNGLRHLLSQPEFDHRPQAQTLADFLEDRTLIHSALAATPKTGVRVVIGTENRENVLHPFALVLSPYGVPGTASGVVAALGPTRMEYTSTIGAVRYVSNLMNTLFQKAYG